MNKVKVPLLIGACLVVLWTSGVWGDEALQREKKGNNDGTQNCEVQP